MKVTGGFFNKSGFYQFQEYKSEIPSDVCEAIKSYKTAQDQKTINQWINTATRKNVFNEEGQTVAHLAIINHHPRLALWFFNRGVNINIVSKGMSENPLMLAIDVAEKQIPGSKLRKNYVDLIKFLIEKKANMEVDLGFGMFKYALSRATTCCDLEIVKLLVENGQADVNYSKDVFSPIRYALASSQPHSRKESVISYLQEKGANLDKLSECEPPGGNMLLLKKRYEVVNQILHLGIFNENTNPTHLAELTLEYAASSDSQLTL